MKYNQKKELVSRISNLIKDGKSQDFILNELKNENFKEYEVNPIFQNAKREIYLLVFPFIHKQDIKELSYLDDQIKMEFLSKYENEKKTNQITRIKELVLKNKSKEEIKLELSNENIDEDLIDQTYEQTFSQNENLNPNILEANIAKLQLQLYLSIAYTILKIAHVSLQMVKNRISIISILTLVIGIIGCIYFANKKRELQSKRS